MVGIDAMVIEDDFDARARPIHAVEQGLRFRIFLHHLDPLAAKSPSPRKVGLLPEVHQPFEVIGVRNHHLLVMALALNRSPRAHRLPHFSKHSQFLP